LVAELGGGDEIVVGRVPVRVGKLVRKTAVDDISAIIFEIRCMQESQSEYNGCDYAGITREPSVFECHTAKSRAANSVS
jgi:hypothetical protein